MHKITFYPIGNADCCKVELEDGRFLLFDYAHTKMGESKDDSRIDLAELLMGELNSANRDCFDVVAFTHADDDHIRGSSEFFYLEHAEKYQNDSRIKITELWVPAAFILEEGLEDEARILRTEARYRLKKKKGIRVFSRPERLKDWLEEQGLKLADIAHLITDAGNCVPDYDNRHEGIELFVHSPFAAHVDGKLEDRNEAALILHATFNCEDEATRFFIIGDTTNKILSDIVNITIQRKREERLVWDIYDIPHHCSYLALSDDKGKDKTEPVSEVKWLLSQGNNHGILVSSSDQIPSKDTDQPPHRQAAACYKEVAKNIEGEFKVTMEYPSVTKPEPLVIIIDKNKARLKKVLSGGSIAIISKPAPRAG